MNEAEFFEKIELDMAEIRKRLTAIEYACGISIDFEYYSHEDVDKLIKDHGFVKLSDRLEELEKKSSEPVKNRADLLFDELCKCEVGKGGGSWSTSNVKRFFGVQNSTQMISVMQECARIYKGRVMCEPSKNTHVLRLSNNELNRIQVEKSNISVQKIQQQEA